MIRFPKTGCAVVALVALGILLPSPAAAQTLDPVESEFRFASGLIDLGFPDFAQRVVGELVRRHPDQADRAQLISAQVLISRGRLAEAREMIEKLPASERPVQQMMLALANALFRRGQTDQAREIYDRFFKQFEGRIPEDPDELRFYQETAYRVAQLQERAGDLAGAATAYQRLLDTNPERVAQRNVMAALATVQVRLAEQASGPERESWLKKAEEVCADIQWGGLDVPFGQSIISMARIRLLRGEEEEARQLLQANLDILERIDGLLRDGGHSLRESPMAGVRFLLGELLRKQGEALLEANRQDEALEPLGNALREFYRVFAVYGESDWGPPAGLQAEELIKILEGMGRTVRVDLGPHAARAAQTRFRTADELYRNGDHAEAARLYVGILNQFPEVPELSARSLGNLLMCYAHLEDRLMVRAVTAYLAERFAGQPAASMALRRLGKHYLDAEQKELYLPVYKAYADHFADDEHAPGVLFSLASLMHVEGDRKLENEFLDRIIERYPDDRNYVRALSRRAWNTYMGQDFEKAAEAFPPYLAVERPGFDKAQAQFCLADSLRQLGRFEESMEAYAQLLDWLREDRGPFYTVAAEAERLAALRMKAHFFLADTLSRAPAEDEDRAAFRDRATDLFTEYVERYPGDELAPKAMDGLGRMHLESGRFERAVETYDELARAYPESDEGRNALYSLVRAAMEVGRTDVARNALADMLANAAAYSPVEFTRLGQLMLDNQAYEDAIRAFEQVSAITEERTFLERALFGLGQAYYRQEQYAEAIHRLEEFNERYPRSGLFYDARFVLGDAYRAAGRSQEAITALSDVFRYADDTVLINRAHVLLGRINRQTGAKEEALAAFQRVALLADPDHPELRPLIRDGILEAIELAMELGLYRDVIDSSGQFEELFPEDERLPEVREARRQARLRAPGA